MTERAITTSALANDMLALANRVDRAGDEVIADSETWAALRHLLESLEAAERTVTRLRQRPQTNHQPGDDVRA